MTSPEARKVPGCADISQIPDGVYYIITGCGWKWCGAVTVELVGPEAEQGAEALASLMRHEKPKISDVPTEHHQAGRSKSSHSGQSCCAEICGYPEQIEELGAWLDDQIAAVSIDGLQAIIQKAARLKSLSGEE